ncbi:MAG: endonuclease/exonuclease/phosphatase family protein [Planctomycetota bacterium]|nr:MAG: endonuclease/exonuclease/phosphatase family protein [Planctomycetota bacterium]
MTDLSSESIPVANSNSSRMPLMRWIRGMRSVFLRFIAYLSWGLIVTGLLLRLTIRDRFHPWALIYYLTPIPGLVIWTVIAGIAWKWGATVDRGSAKFSLTRLNFAAMLAFVFWTYQSEFVNHPQTRNVDPQTSHEAGLRVVFWNTAHVPSRVGPPAKQLRKWNPTLFGLVEANTYYRTVAEEWRREFTDYAVATTHFGGLIAVRGQVQKQISHSLLPNSWCEQFDLRVEDQDFTVLLVDISAQLNQSRRRPLLELAQLAVKLSDRPLIIMGDFNTPDDSILLQPLLFHCRLAMREQGTGFTATWPIPLPVLTLDQIWVNEFVDVWECHNSWSRLSDHRPILGRLTISPP